MANLERLWQSNGRANIFGGRAQAEPQGEAEGTTSGDDQHDTAQARREAGRQEARRQQQSYFEPRTMAPTNSYADNSGWAPPYTWDPENPMYVPAFSHIRDM